MKAEIDIFRKLTITRNAVILGYSAIIVVLFIALKDQKFQTHNSEQNTIFSIVSLLVLFGLVPASFYFYNRMAKKSRSENNRFTRLELYRKAVVLRIGLTEACGVVPLIAFTISGNPQLVLIALAPLILLFTIRPSSEQFENDFENNIS